MKVIMLLLTMMFVFTTGAFAIDGERTGHFKKLEYAKVAVIMTKQQKIPKQQVESVVFKPGSQQTLENIEVLRVNGLYITAEDITGAEAQ